MKRKWIWFVLLFLSFTFGVAFTAFAETWSCAYLYDGKARNIIFTREGNRFYNAEKSDYDEIVHEDDTMISLQRSFSTNLPMYFATLLDKKKKMFSSIGINREYNTDFLNGECKVF